MEIIENQVYEKIISDLLEQQYSVVEDFFSLEQVEELRNSLLTKYEEDNFKKAAIGNRTNEVIAKSIRGDFILWLNEAEAAPAEKAFFSKINDFVNYLNRTCFMGILHKEFHYALYPEGTFYRRHLDTFQNDDRRKLSMVCYLNEQDWQPEYGGELVIYRNENGKEVPKSIYPFPGRMVIFESQILEHEVKPVKTERLSITGWLKTR
ncbi:MAG: 2OG-Fe(II) oxygenase [Salinimicrobium sediminis]|uniref:SM-20-related protein n=1 Tax=Salinimicrobium sediminis TaxID=1343891 RepID=A0A285X3B2_9FLAO|nr:2OG-Fe(II) oxygenase [Salinimicrobium sediminis]MDX1603105.1 2OG-Fe(II) oxygenase [Salinimicrobium sediminis]MDX1752301.1 2OG-Fe(II) oxygenase [Salinimicrobium sediminis]SOC79244.1 SM-20-related protein [Salinimicrobium sediminis]